MMVLQDWSIVVKNSKARPWLSVEVDGGAGVVVVMDDGGEKEGEDLQVWQPRLARKLLGNIIRMKKDLLWALPEI